MTLPSLRDLSDFIVRAKAATYAGGGNPAPSCRPGSHDLEFSEGEFSYLDSYFGGSDFLGQEVVWFRGIPVWAMNYYGRILQPEGITAEETGCLIKAGLTGMYREGRFLGGYELSVGKDRYADNNQGDAGCFSGKEYIERGGKRVYELMYAGGWIRD